MCLNKRIILNESRIDEEKSVSWAETATALKRFTDIPSVENLFRFRSKQDFFNRCDGPVSEKCSSIAGKFVVSGDEYTVLAASDQPTHPLRSGQFDCSLLDALIEAHTREGELVTSSSDWWLPAMQIVSQAMREVHQEANKPNLEDCVQPKFQLSENFSMLEATLEMINAVLHLSSENTMCSDQLLRSGMIAGATVPARLSAQSICCSKKQVFHSNSHSETRQQLFTDVSGLRAVTLLGKREHWQALVDGWQNLYAEVHDKLKDFLSENWWESVRFVYSELLHAWDGQTNKAFWKSLVVNETESEAENYKGLLWVLFSKSKSDSKAIEVKHPIHSLPISMGIGKNYCNGILMSGAVGYTVQKASTLSKHFCFKPHTAWCCFVHNDMVNQLKQK